MSIIMVDGFDHYTGDPYKAAPFKTSPMKGHKAYLVLEQDGEQIMKQELVAVPESWTRHDIMLLESDDGLLLNHQLSPMGGKPGQIQAPRRAPITE